MSPPVGENRILSHSESFVEIHPSEKEKGLKTERGCGWRKERDGARDLEKESKTGREKKLRQVPFSFYFPPLRGNSPLSSTISPLNVSTSFSKEKGRWERRRIPPSKKKKKKKTTQSSTIPQQQSYVNNPPFNHRVSLYITKKKVWKYCSFIIKNLIKNIK